MIRPDHAWWFFTVVLSLALAMSIPPRKAELENRASVYGLEQSIQLGFIAPDYIHTSDGAGLRAANPNDRRTVTRANMWFLV